MCRTGAVFEHRELRRAVGVGRAIQIVARNRHQIAAGRVIFIHHVIAHRIDNTLDPPLVIVIVFKVDAKRFAVDSRGRHAGIIEADIIPVQIGAKSFARDNGDVGQEIISKHRLVVVFVPQHVPAVGSGKIVSRCAFWSQSRCYTRIRRKRGVEGFKTEEIAAGCWRKAETHRPLPGQAHKDPRAVAECTPNSEAPRGRVFCLQRRLSQVQPPAMTKFETLPRIPRVVRARDCDGNAGDVHRKIGERKAEVAECQLLGHIDGQRLSRL